MPIGDGGDLYSTTSGRFMIVGIVDLSDVPFSAFLARTLT